MPDRLDDWLLFVSVATRRSFAETARALGRSPQGVTRAVAALEKRLGTRLLHRTTRSVSLTDDGARYLERATTVLADFEALESRTEGDLHGTVSVAAPVLYGRLYVAPIVQDFLRDHEGVAVRLVLHDRIVSLADEGIDLAVRIGALADSSLRARHVGDVRLVVCATPAYLRRRGAILDVADLARHDVISLTGTTPIPDRWTFGRRVVGVRPRLVTTDVQTAIDAALAGIG